MAREERLQQTLIRDTTGFLVFLLVITTIGPFQFGFHLVSCFDCVQYKS